MRVWFVERLVAGVQQGAEVEVEASSYMLVQILTHFGLSACCGTNYWKNFDA